MKSKGNDAGTRRKALGRGLNALLSSKDSFRRETLEQHTPPTSDSIRNIPLELIDPNPEQPRQIFRDDSIQELARSIRVDGVIQPIVVRPNGERFFIVVGERRWRAAKIAGIPELPAIVRHIDPDRILEVTLVENIQREDLNPIEVALALNRMAHEFHLSHEELAARTGKDRTTVTNLLRLLKLPGDIQNLVAERRLSMGHARALLPVDDPEQQRRLAEKTAAQGLSVRQVERLVRNLSRPRPSNDGEPAPDPNVASALEQLEQALGTRVRLVQRGSGKGRIEIEFHSQEDLDRIYSVIVRG